MHGSLGGAVGRGSAAVLSGAMAPLTPDQARRRDRVESLIRLAAPGLNLLLAVGERVSRLVEPEDHEYYPPRTRGGAPQPAPPPAGQRGVSPRQ